MDIGNFRKKSEVDEDAWAEWLGSGLIDSAVPKIPAEKPVASLRVDGFISSKSQPKARKQAASLNAPSQNQPTVSIQIHMPQLHMPRVSVPWRKLLPWLIGTAILVLLLLGGKGLQAQLSRSKPTTQKAPVVPAADLGYKPLLPPVRTDTNVAIPKPTYDQQRQLYTFNDVYKGAKLTINQQAVPDKLKGNDTEIKKLATNLGMTDTFSTTIGMAHIVTSKESGVQRLFVINNKMLMFIQSTQTVSNVDWVNYIQDLQ